MDLVLEGVMKRLYTASKLGHTG